MTESKQDAAMRQRHMEQAMQRLANASDELEEAAAWLFDLDYMPVLGQVGAAKTVVDTAKIEVSRIYEREFPGE